MSINLKKCHILSLGVHESTVSKAAMRIGCSALKTPLNYLGIMVGGNMSLVKSWDEIIYKFKKWLSIWKLKTLSIGGRFTLLKSVLGSTPIYNLSLFKVLKLVLNKMENLCSNFFNGIQEGDRKIVWVKWLKVWRFISGDNSLWCKFILAIHGSSHSTSTVTYPSIWKSILKEFNSLKVQGIDIFSHCKIKIGNGLCTCFWKDRWLDNTSLADSFPRLFALETDIDISVAAKLHSIVASFRRSVRGGVEDHQLHQLVSMLDYVILSTSIDRWICDLNGDGIFRVKDVRNLLDEFFLSRVNVPTRWVNVVPIKVNIFAWKLALDRLPTRTNLALRGVVSDPLLCPICESHVKDSSHLFFNCSLAKDVMSLVCRWWDVGVLNFTSYAEWLVWFNAIRFGSKLKIILEGIFYVTWWSLWTYQNQYLFTSKKPHKDSIFDDIVLRFFCWCNARGSFKFKWLKIVSHMLRASAINNLKTS
uniref:RNA-directed DNA polymerase, eukaryota n=1 Tax=Tanacetum cinerariifolium TaxID=118510 RepID=A0A699I558_TANCI|nr:RNA-directed DNA polymerase, eukaryota [Tanacetum cinerariifolium]